MFLHSHKISKQILKKTHSFFQFYGIFVGSILITSLFLVIERLIFRHWDKIFIQFLLIIERVCDIFILYFGFKLSVSFYFDILVKISFSFNNDDSIAFHFWYRRNILKKSLLYPKDLKLNCFTFSCSIFMNNYL